MKFFFSPSTLGAYPSDMLDVYKMANSLPDDLVELTFEEYQTFFSMPAPENQQLSANASGKPCFVHIEINIEDIRLSSIRQIDDESATVTKKWTRFTEEYKEREAAAIAYKEAGYTGDASIYITSFSEPAGITNQEATDLILKQANDLRALQSQLAAERMRKYELKQPDLTLDDIATSRDEIIANIRTLGESYE